MPYIDSPTRRREGVRATLRELVRTSAAIVDVVPREAELPRRRLQSVLSRLHALAGPLEDAVEFDDVFRDEVPEPTAQRTSVAERDEARLSLSSLEPGLIARLLDDADALAASRERQDILEARLAEARDREIGLYDGHDMFDRLRINERRPVVDKSSAMEPAHLRQVIASLDAAGMTKAAETLIWAAWHYERAHAKARGLRQPVEATPVRVELHGLSAFQPGASGEPVPGSEPHDPRHVTEQRIHARGDQAR